MQWFQSPSSYIAFYDSLPSFLERMRHREECELIFIMLWKHNVWSASAWRQRYGKRLYRVTKCHRSNGITRNIDPVYVFFCKMCVCVCFFWHTAMINFPSFLFFQLRSFSCQNEISARKDFGACEARHRTSSLARCMKDENLRRNEMSYVEEWRRMMERSNKREGNGNCRMEEIFSYWFWCDKTRRRTRRRRNFKDSNFS